MLIVNVQLCKQRDLFMKDTELFFRVFLRFKKGLKFDLTLRKCLLLGYSYSTALVACSACVTPLQEQIV